MEIKLATVRAAYRILIGRDAQNVPSIAMISQSIKSASLRKETKSLNRFLIPMDSAF
jgi:hypothetical protein